MSIDAPSFEPIAWRSGFGPAALRGRAALKGFQIARDRDRAAVERRAGAARRGVGLLERRRVDHAGDRAAVDNERGRDRPARIAGDESPRAVDRIDHEEDPPRETVGAVRRLLREPSRLRERLAQAPLQERVGGEIGLRHRRAAELGLNVGGCGGAQAEEPERERPGLARGGGQAVARGERAPIRVDVQWGVRGMERVEARL